MVPSKAEGMEKGARPARALVATPGLAKGPSSLLPAVFLFHVLAYILSFLSTQCNRHSSRELAFFTTKL